MSNDKIKIAIIGVGEDAEFARLKLIKHINELHERDKFEIVSFDTRSDFDHAHMVDKSDIMIDNNIESNVPERGFIVVNIDDKNTIIDNITNLNKLSISKDIYLIKKNPDIYYPEYKDKKRKGYERPYKYHR